ncbi:MAG: hypothetical protein K8R21_05855, partial [Leptospira sp.]|nr:hypothetical protein [Leptospira sp.]
RIAGDLYAYQAYNLTLTKDSQAVIKFNGLTFCRSPLTSSVELKPTQSSAVQLEYQSSFSGGTDSMRSGFFFTLSSGSGSITLNYN